VAVSFIGGGNQCPEKTTDLWQVTDKIYLNQFQIEAISV